MKYRVGILTSGGDCPGLNAAIRGVAKASYGLFDCEIIGIEGGFKGLINNNYKIMKQEDFSDLLTRGGTILGSFRTPFKKMRKIDEDGIDKVAAMVKNYKKLKLDCLVTIGGNGTHKNANLLREEGLNIIGIPKTIDNDIWGTDITFGFHSALDIATDVIDRIHTTADSHNRVMVIELMGHHAGWLTLYAGVAGGADVILIPEIPFNIERVVQAINNRREKGKDFSIVVVAEGAISEEEAKMGKKELKSYRESLGFSTISYRIADEISKRTDFETRVTVPGHQQRGGSPSPYDRVLSTTLGAFAAEMISNKDYGKTVSIINNKPVTTPLQEMAHKLKLVEPDNKLIETAKKIGVSFG